MKLIIGLVSTVLVLSMVHNAKSDIYVTCLPDDAIYVSVNVTARTDLKNKYVSVADTAQCNTTNMVQLEDDPADMSLQMATVTCFNFTLYESFLLAFVTNDSFNFNVGGLITFNTTCELPDNYTVSYDNITVTANPTEDIITVEYEPALSVSVQDYILAVGDNITFNIALGNTTADDIVLAVYEVIYEVVGTGLPFWLIEDRCPATNTPVSAVITGDTDSSPAVVEVEVNIPSFTPNNQGIMTASVVLLDIVVVFCPIFNNADCTGTCPDGSAQIGRKKRQDFDESTIVERRQEAVLLFPTQEVKQDYVDRILEEAGLSMQQQTGPKEGEICVNKTVTGVLLALLLIALALCLISSVIMFVKLRKNRTDNLVKSDHSYSNKGY